jgi:hypothetical protein
LTAAVDDWAVVSFVPPRNTITITRNAGRIIKGRMRERMKYLLIELGLDLLAAK